MKITRRHRRKFQGECGQDGEKDERKNSEMFQNAPIECSNGSEASGEEHPFVE